MTIEIDEQHEASVTTLTGLTPHGVSQISKLLRSLLADVFALYLKTKNFHWHMSGPHFRDYHLLLDEHADQVFAMTDAIAERARKLGATTLHSISDISRHQRLQDNNEEFVTPNDMIVELRSDNEQLTRHLRFAHEICSHYRDAATTSMIEVWIDESERRCWFLTQIVQEVKAVGSFARYGLASESLSGDGNERSTNKKAANT